MLLRSIKIALFVFAMTMGSVAPSAEIDDASLAQGLSAYQAGQFEEAKKILSELLAQQPNNSGLLYNLGLVEFKAGRVGQAAGFWRKALTISPTLDEARTALEFLTAKSPKGLNESGGTFWEVFQSRILDRVHIDSVLAVSALSTLWFGWALMGYLGRRRKSFLEEAPLPTLSKGLIFSGLMFVLSVTTLTMKGVDVMTVRATVVASNVEARTGPGETHAALFELFEGAAVQVQNSENGWAQVRSVSGRVGWVEANKIYVTSGTQPW